MNGAPSDSGVTPETRTSAGNPNLTTGSNGASLYLVNGESNFLANDIETRDGSDLTRARVHKVHPRVRRIASDAAARKAQRSKVSRACDACKTKKIRCSGDQPCVRCLGVGLPCSYLAIYTRGRPPSVHSSNVPLEARGSVIRPEVHSTPQLVPNNVSPVPAPSFPEVVPFPQHSTSYGEGEGEARAADPSSRNSPVPSAAVGGIYHGPSSPITFLERARRRFKRNYVSSSARTLERETSGEKLNPVLHEKQSLHIEDESLCMPTEQHARELVAKYFDFSTVFFQFLHRCTVEEWLNVFYNELHENRTPNGSLSTRKITVLLMIFAAASFDGANDGWDTSSAGDQSLIYLQAAQRQLQKDMGSPSLESVQARLIECLSLLSTSRANESYSKFGILASMMITLGLHRRKRKGGYRSSEIGLVEQECRKRTFWAAYILDRYLSVMGGRPRMVQDVDSDQDFPVRVDDRDLTVSEIRSRVDTFDCHMDAPIAHTKLARISGRISASVYSLHSISPEERLTLAERFTNELRAWQAELPPLFRIPASSLIPTFQRQSIVLRLAYAHAVIHANRPFLLSNFADGPTPQGFNKYIHECVKAARDVVDILDTFDDSGFPFHSWWFTQYVSFCAVAVLYIYTIQQRQKTISSPSDTASVVATQWPDAFDADKDYFVVAEHCQRRITAEAKENSPGKRYNVFLEELRQEVHRQVSSSDAHLGVSPEDTEWNYYLQQGGIDDVGFMAQMEMDVTSLFDNWAVPEWTY